MAKVSLKDIAERCGVSMQTVSCALKPESSGGTTRISDAKRTMIRQVAAEMGYQVNLTAVALRSGRSRSIGIIRSIWLSSRSSLLSNIIRRLNENNYDAVITNTPLNGDFSASLHTLESRMMDGIIICGASKSPGGIPRLSVPIVDVGSDNSDVRCDLGKGMALLAEHLYQHGHRRFGIVCTVPDKIKEEGVRSVLHSHGLKLDDENVIAIQKNPECMKQLRRAIVDNKVTAVMCTNDLLAGKLIHYLQRHGVRVPQDVAVTGCDGLIFTRFFTPSITTFYPPDEKLAELTVSRLLNKIAHRKQEAGPILVEPCVKYGESCGCQEKFENHLFWINSFATIDENENTVGYYDDEPCPESLNGELDYSAIAGGVEKIKAKPKSVFKTSN